MRSAMPKLWRLHLVGTKQEPRLERRKFQLPSPEATSSGRLTARTASDPIDPDVGCRPQAIRQLSLVMLNVP